MVGTLYVTILACGIKVSMKIVGYVSVKEISKKSRVNEGILQKSRACTSGEWPSDQSKEQPLRQAEV
jgi:hypothetical protein